MLTGTPEQVNTFAAGAICETRPARMRYDFAVMSKEFTLTARAAELRGWYRRPLGRLLAEAERSLDHARTEPGGIVGFRPDPRKYRQFVTQHLRND